MRLTRLVAPTALALLLVAGSAAAQRPLVPELCHAEPHAAAAVSPTTPTLLSRVVVAKPAEPTPTGFPGFDLSFEDYFNFFNPSRWEETATDGSGLSQGDPTVITWSIVPDGTYIPAYGGGTEVAGDSDLRAFLDTVYGSESVWLPLFEQAFTRWSELTGITYVYVDDDGADWGTGKIDDGVLGVRGDVRIAGHYIDGAGSNNQNTLAYNFAPGDGGDMVIDTGDTGTFSNSADNWLKLRNVLAHEHGHGLGLKHSCPIEKTKLMEPYLTGKFDGPQHDDILGANRLYGDAMEPNDTPGTASDLGYVDPWEGVTLSDVSIDDVSDVDFYSFTVPWDVKVRVTLTPVGETYLAGATSGGSCLSSENYDEYDSLDNQDLALEVLDTDGVTVLGSADANGAGSGESLVVDLSGFGPYYVQVSGSTTEAQMYELSLDWTGGTTGIVNYGNVSVDENFVTLSSANFETPRLLTGPPTVNGTAPVTSRVDAYSDGTWDWRLQEWDYLDGTHNLETAGYLIVRDGAHKLGSLDAEAGTATVDENWVTVSFTQSFSSAPVVLAQVASTNGSHAVTPRIRNVTTTGFEMFLQEEEANDGTHADERVDWLAVETGVTAFKGIRMVVALTGDAVTESWYGVDYSGKVRSTGLVEPTLLAQMQTFDGTDPATIRMRNLDSYSFEIKIQEEQSLDSETNHNSENVGYVLIGVN